MAQITVKDIYSIMVQKKDEFKYTDKTTGKEVVIPAQEEREAICVIAEYDEYTMPFILPAHFDYKSQKVEVGTVLNVNCPGIDNLQPLMIRNVNRVINDKLGSKK